MMDTGRSWIVLLLVLTPVISGAWREDRNDLREPQDMRRSGIHYHTKRHMLPPNPEIKKRVERTTPKTVKVIRKKPSGHLTPLEDDDMENDEMVSVAIGPPTMGMVLRPKFEKLHRKHSINKHKPQYSNLTAVNLVREVLTQLGRDFLTRDVSENFVFGQYVGNSMKNLTNELRLKMQHDILDLILKYQKMNNTMEVKKEKSTIEALKTNKIEKVDKKFVVEKSGNETDEIWPDFSNLANIVG